MKRFVKALACLLCAVLTVSAFLPVMPVRAAGTAYNNLSCCDGTCNVLSPETAEKRGPQTAVLCFYVNSDTTVRIRLL